MPLNDSQKIKIKTVGGGKDKDDLLKCFFYPTTPAGPPYDFYKKENGVETLLASGITTGGSFSFSLDTYTWNVPDPNNPTNPFWINTQGAGGSWTNNDTSVSITDQSTGETGTFQAQTGTSADPEEASTATA
jgi:hypothetical protein